MSDSDTGYLTDDVIPGGRRFGKWSHPGVPHRGWSCVGIEDLGEPSEQCDMCEMQTIRYVHEMQHPDYPGILRCGCVCAGHMEGDLDGARTREKTARNNAGRRQRWLTREWHRSQKGNSLLKVDGFRIVIYPVGKLWGFRITNTATGFSFPAKILLETEDAAKMRSYVAMEWCKEKGL